MSALNFMPSSTDFASFADALAGVAVFGHTVHGHGAKLVVVKLQEYGADMGLPVVSTTPDTVAVYVVLGFNGPTVVSRAVPVGASYDTAAGTVAPWSSASVIARLDPCTGL